MLVRTRSRLTRWAAFVVPLALACGGESSTSPPPGGASATTGTLVVLVRAIGSGRQTAEVPISVDGLWTSARADTTLHMASMAPGSHIARVGTLAPQCQPLADSVSANVRAGATDTALVVISCVGGIAYHVVESTGGYQLYYLDESGQTIQLTKGPGVKFMEDWSPDGTKLLFSIIENGARHLYTVRADGTELKQLTSGSHDDIRARWAPDGRRIAFYRSRFEGAQLYMWTVLIDADGGNERVLLDSLHMDFDPVWSPDGSELFFTCDRFSPQWNLCAASPSGTGLRRIRYAAIEALDVPPPCPVGTCMWFGTSIQHWVMAPDGSGIMFYTIRSPSNGPEAMWVGALDGSSAIPLTPGTGSFDARWSPDARRALVGIANGTGGFALMTAKREGGGSPQLSAYANRDEAGRWSGDGTLVAFDSFRNGPQQLWVSNPDGTGAHVFVSGLMPGFMPLWNPKARANVPLVSRASAPQPLAPALAPTRSVAAGRIGLRPGECRVVRAQPSARLDCAL